jgi:hypothetical protein
MATLATQTINRLGIAETLAAANAGGDAMECGSGMALKVTNGGGAPITVTLAIPAGASGYPDSAYTNTVVTVPAGASRWIGPVRAEQYRDPTTGLCTITYSAVTTVTVGAFKNPGV